MGSSLFEELRQLFQKARRLRLDKIEPKIECMRNKIEFRNKIKLFNIHLLCVFKTSLSETEILLWSLWKCIKPVNKYCVKFQETVSICISVWRWLISKSSNLLLQSAGLDCIQKPKSTDSDNLSSVLCQLEGHFNVRLSTQVVNLGRTDCADYFDLKWIHVEQNNINSLMFGPHFLRYTLIKVVTYSCLKQGKQTRGTHDPQTTSVGSKFEHNWALVI